MKKIVSLLSVLVILFAFCFTGCTFIDESLNGSNVNSSQNGGGSSGGTSSVTPVEPEDTITFNTFSSEERMLLSLVDAVALVDRTSVAISIGSGAGSGVIIDVLDAPNNIVYIVTCHHVIASGGDVTLYIPDENGIYENPDYTFTGTIGNSIYEKAVTLVGGDRVSDIAVLKLDLTYPAYSGNVLAQDKIVKAKVPSADYALKKGESVFAIGNPTGALPGSVVSGVISYLERDTLVGDVGNMTLMQIGVSTNPGNSGGGLYNLYGELIGITNAGNTNYVDMNFAIPCELSNGNGFINIAKHLIKSATETNYGYVPLRWEMGIVVQEQRIGFNQSVVVASIIENSNCYEKLQVGDIIETLSWTSSGKSKTYAIAADGDNFKTATESFSFYASLMRTELEKNDTFHVGVIRGNARQTISVEIARADYIFCNTGN